MNTFGVPSYDPIADDKNTTIYSDGEVLVVQIPNGKYLVYKHSLLWYVSVDRFEALGNACDIARNWWDTLGL